MDGHQGQIIHMSIGRLYRYGIATFEWHDYIGPTPLNRHTELERDYRGLKARWWADFYRWHCLTKDQRENYRKG